MPKVRVEAVDQDELRRQQWTHGAADRLRKARERRVRELEDRHNAIRDGIDTLSTEHVRGTQCSTVVLRPAFYWRNVDLQEIDADPACAPQRARENPDVLKAALARSLAGRPPLSRLVNRGGAALPLELAALAVAQFRRTSGPSNVEGIPNTGGHSWAKIIGDSSRTEPVRRHLATGLERLKREALVALRSLHGRGWQSYDGWELLAEDGSTDPYTVPDHGLKVPADFWLTGWAAVLTGPEIVTYLMLRHLAEDLPGVHANQGVGVAPRVRNQRYGVSKEAYACASEMEEFGLLRRTTQRRSSVPQGAAGASVSEVQRFQIVEETLKLDAYDTVSAALTTQRTPARVAQYDPMYGFDPAGMINASTANTLQ